MSQAISLGDQAVSASPSTGKGLDEWSFAIDSKTGNVYFYNRRTRETRWTLPSNESTSSGSLISSLSHAHNVLKKVQAEEEQKTTPTSNELMTTSIPVLNGKEKENHIREAIDPHTGKKYYYDTITRKSYWEDPRIVGTALLNQRGPDTPERQRIIPTATIDDARAMRALSSARNIGFNNSDTTTKTTLNGDLEGVRVATTTTATSKRPSTSIVDELRGISLSKNEQETNRIDHMVNGETKETSRPPKTVEQSAMLKGTKAQTEDSAEVKPTSTTMTNQQGLTSTWSSIPDMELTKRSSASTDTFLKRSVSTKSSSQERLLPFVIERNEDAYNEDDLRLLKERIKMGKAHLISTPEKPQSLKPQISEVKPSRPSSTTTSKSINSHNNGLARNEQNRSSENGFGAKNVSQPRTSSSSSAVSNRGASSDTCLRRSGCTCRACSTGIQETTIVEESTDLVPCGTCGRKFNPKSLVVHERVCDKVFAKRSTGGKSPENEDAKAKSKKIASTPVVSQGMSKWRKQSQELRQAMMRGRNSSNKSVLADSSMFNESGVNDNQGNNSEMFDDGLVTCPHCERRFNEKAAERHIPKCNDIRSKPKTLRKGEGRAVHTALLHSPALGGPSSPSKTPGSVGGPRKSLGSGGQQQVPLGDRVTGVACPFCRRQFAVKNLARHLEICAQQRAGPRTSLGGRSSVAAGSLLRKQTSASPSSRSSGSWDGGHFE